MGQNISTIALFSTHIRPLGAQEIHNSALKMSYFANEALDMHQKMSIRCQKYMSFRGYCGESLCIYHKKSEALARQTWLDRTEACHMKPLI